MAACPLANAIDAWARARSGDVSVIVGTRSALFTPLPKLGVIVLDEEHDASYKQSPWMIEPHYHARDAAEYLAERHGAALILGSATPDLATWHLARRGHFGYLHLPERIMGHRRRIQQQASRFGVEARYQEASAEAVTIPLPPVSVVDMRAELRAGNTSMFSRELQESLAAVLERDEQAMLLLNRRGQATYVFCRDCGYALECARCDTPMTYHRVDRSLRCHHCGASQAQPESCPACGSSRIRYFGAGTQQVDQVLKDLFPAVRTLRWDVDSARSPKMHFEILERFIKREADVLIGTQMIAKGLDLPLVTLVGVVSADIGLALPDYRAGERVFQLLTQVAGRAPGAAFLVAKSSCRPTCRNTMLFKRRRATITRVSLRARASTGGGWVILPIGVWRGSYSLIPTRNRRGSKRNSPPTDCGRSCRSAI